MLSESQKNKRLTRYLNEFRNQYPEFSWSSQTVVEDADAVIFTDNGLLSFNIYLQSLESYTSLSITLVSVSNNTVICHFDNLLWEDCINVINIWIALSKSIVQYKGMLG